MELMEEIVSLKKSMKGSFEHFAEHFGNTLNEMKERAEERNIENKKMIRKLTDQIEQFENNKKCVYCTV